MGKHCLLTYRSDEEFMARMEEFVRTGLAREEAVVFVASTQHLAELDKKLASAGVDVSAARKRDSYIAICADSLLEGLLVNDWPREERFRAFLETLVATEKGRRVRVVGELGALLIERNQPMVAVALEEYLHQARKKYGFDLFCAYPEELFRNQQPYFHAICAAHSDVLRGSGAGD